MGFLQLLDKARGKKKETKETQKLLTFASEQGITSLFQLLGMVAKANGRVTRGQIKATEQIYRRFVPESFHPLAKDSFRKGKELHIDKEVVSRLTFPLYWKEEGRWLEPLQILDLLLSVAFADKEYGGYEEYIVENARATLGVHMRTYWILRDTLAEQRGITISRDTASFADKEDISRKNEKKTAPPPKREKLNRSDALEILQLTEDATDDDIRNAYRKLVKKYHPDLLMSGECSDLELRDAIQKFREVQEAYEALT